MFRHIMRDFFLSTQDEMQSHKLLKSYPRFWITCAGLILLLYPIAGLVAALMAASPISFIVLLAFELVFSKSTVPMTQRCSIACRAVMFIVFIIALPASAVLNAIEALSQTMVLDEDILSKLASRYLFMPLVVILSVYTIRQVRPTPSNQEG